jgi:hypothetical protein
MAFATFHRVKPSAQLNSPPHNRECSTQRFVCHETPFYTAFPSTKKGGVIFFAHASSFHLLEILYIQHRLPLNITTSARKFSCVKIKELRGVRELFYFQSHNTNTTQGAIGFHAESQIVTNLEC